MSIMKFRYIGERKVIIPRLGEVKPGQEFDCNNPKFKDLFMNSKIFEQMDKKNTTRKVEKKENPPKKEGVELND